VSTAERVAAELEIRTVLALLAQHADTGTIEEYLALFTDDVVWELPANEKMGLAASVRRGLDDVAAGARERRATGGQGPGTDTLHVLTTVAVDVDVDAGRATSRSVFLFFTDASTTPTLRTMGRYRDELRRTTGGWKLAHRTIHFGQTTAP
jgi:3-phenylpropionate/cinnamic acid dioxygenase small subunit